MVRVEIERVHLEEDTGKSLHKGGSTGRIHGADYSLVDYNRAGIPLVEIVTKPVTGTGALAPEAGRAYVTELRDLLRALGVSDVRMEEGSLRADVNTSLAPIGSGRWGTRTETKNVNSLRSVERAIRYEIERQAATLDAGHRVMQETRHFHEDSGITTAGRSKEEAQDYRYFPEPDLVPIAPSPDWVAELRASLPELPSARRARLQSEWALSDLDMAALAHADALDLVAGTVAAGATPADARKWWLGELRQRANAAGVELSALSITPAQVARVSELVASGVLNDQLARQVLDAVLAGEGSPDDIVARPPAGRGQRRQRPARRRGRRHRRPPGRGRQGPRRQDPGRRRPGRRGHEGHPRPSRRHPRPRANPRPPGCGLKHSLDHPAVGCAERRLPEQALHACEAHMAPRK